MKRIIGLVAAALTLGGCVLYTDPGLPAVYGPGPGVYVSPPPVIIVPDRPGWGGRPGWGWRGQANGGGFHRGGWGHR